MARILVGQNISWQEYGEFEVVSGERSAERLPQSHFSVFGLPFETFSRAFRRGREPRAKRVNNRNLSV